MRRPRSGSSELHPRSSDLEVVEIDRQVTCPSLVALGSDDPAFLSAHLAITPRNTSIEYDRNDWQHWIDADGDCQDTRAEVLIAESMAPVTLAGSGCTVTGGSWTSHYDGAVWTNTSDVDIDHIVPLGNAHVSGGWAWDAATKRAYANDFADAGHLVAVRDKVNSSKGDRAPGAGKPSSLGRVHPLSRLFSERHRPAR